MSTVSVHSSFSDFNFGAEVYLCTNIFVYFKVNFFFNIKKVNFANISFVNKMFPLAQQKHY